MTPEVYYLELHIAQVANEMSLINDKVKAGLYDNKKLIEYIDTLNAVVEEIRKTDLATETDNDKEQLRDILVFLSSCIQYIKSATVNDMNAAIYVCLRAALEDWAKDNPLNYVMTSYKAEVETHHYSAKTLKKQAIKAIYDNYSIAIPSKLVALGYPSYLEKDYLSNVSLYHELGHFIDLKEWEISLNLTADIIKNKVLPLKDVYFKNIEEVVLFDNSNPKRKAELLKLYNIIGEYFADIFAAQYVGRHKNHLLNYIGGDSDFSESHPSTEARNIAIKNFLGPEAQHDDFILMLKKATMDASKKELKIRNVSLDATPLFAGKPCTIVDKHQLHSLLHAGWEIWETNTNGYRQTPDTISAYNKMNKLLEDSIMSYENSR